MTLPEHVETFLRIAKYKLEESPTGDYCIRRYDEYGNAHHEINWSVIHAVYGCAIYVRPPRYSRRLLIVPGAVIAYTTDGIHRYCTVYKTLDVLSEVDDRWEIHVNEWPPNYVEFVRAVCLR
jgi:hypothetical protein